jgi:hypothetical protein
MESENQVMDRKVESPRDDSQYTWLQLQLLYSPRERQTCEEIAEEGESVLKEEEE